MADLRNCIQCGRVFAFQGSKVCSKCQEAVEGEFTIVRKYVRDHPGADVMEVAEATGVTEEKILQFLREGRLISKGFVESLKCERCGAKIDAGRYCGQCLHELDNQFKTVLPGKSAHGTVRDNRDGMHIKKDARNI